MTGWELEAPGLLLLNSWDRLDKKLKSFLKAYPLAAISKDKGLLLIIRKYHPLLNCSPDDELYKAAGFRYGLAYYSINSYMYFELPAYDYTGITIQYDKNTGGFSFTITAKEIVRTTNVRELSQKLNDFTVRDEALKRALFESLTNKLPFAPQPALITRTEIHSTVLGKLNNPLFDDWWSIEGVSIPYFDTIKVPVTFIDYNPEEDPFFLAEADETLGNFLSKTNEDRLSASLYVYKNCMDFLEAIGFDEADAGMWHMKDPQEVWQFVSCRSIYVLREPYQDKQVYLLAVCSCEWEQEHGLQLVFNKQGRLIRVSADDGHIMGWQGDGMIE